jgi:hypothetical protein
MPPDQKAELLHAILFRVGACPVKSNGQEQPASLQDRAKAIFDTVKM